MPDDTAERFDPVVQDIARVVSETWPHVLRGDDSSPEPSRYVYGPLGQGGMYEAVTFVIHVATDATIIAGSVNDWFGIGEWAVRFKRWANDRMRRASAPAGRPIGGHLLEDDGVVFTPTLVRAVCLAHAITSYGPAAGGETVSAYCRHFERGSADLPSGGELYHVTLASPTGTVHYVVTGTLRPRDHFAVTADGVTPLELPDFGDLSTSASAGVGEVQVLPPLHVRG